MKNGDFQLGNYVMGRDWPVFVSDFQLGQTADRSQDIEDPLSDARWFGRDQITPGVWSFKFSISNPAGTLPAAGVLDAVEDLTAVWRHAVDTNDPGSYATLFYTIAGRTRCVFGRPRNLAVDPSRNLEDGNVVGSAQFVLMDTFTYAEQLEQVELTLRQPPVGSALALPAVWPVTTTVDSVRQGIITPGGKAARYYPEDITFFGPVADPVLTSKDWTVALKGVSIPYDGYIRVNPRSRSVLWNSGGSAAGKLTRSTYLPDVMLTPGTQDLKFTGVDSTATARAVVRWRPAYYGL